MNELKTDAVNPELMQLLSQLMEKDYLKNFCLVGGTALALQLGHRKSDDIDLFSNSENDYIEIKYEIGLLSSQIKDVFKNSVLAIINNIKVDVIQFNYPWLEEPKVIDGIRIAGLKDIAAMKLSAIAQRGRKKDFWDLYFLLEHFDIKEMLEFFRKKFNQNEINHVLRSINYFDEAEPDKDPVAIIPMKWVDVKSKILNVTRALIF